MRCYIIANSDINYILYDDSQRVQWAQKQIRDCGAERTTQLNNCLEGFSQYLKVLCLRHNLEIPLRRYICSC